MRVERNISPLRTVAQLIFLAMPTLFVLYFILGELNSYYTVLRNQQLYQCLYFGIGLVTSILFYAFRFRFISTYIILITTLYLIYKSLDKFGANLGEFDAFFISIQFLIFAILFGIGWFSGWLLQRVKYGASIIAGSILLSCILLINKTGGFNYLSFITLFIPIILYTVYLTYTSNALINVDVTNKAFWKRFILKLLGFLLLSSVLIVATSLFLKKEIEAKIADAQGQGTENENGVVKRDKEGNVSFSDAMKVSAKNKRSNELVFCAYIENYFPNTDVPNPLYLTSYHYTKFDTLTETFERDSLMPFNDEFIPELGNMSLFSSTTDSAVLKNANSIKLRNTIEVEIYNKLLNKNTFLAPTTSYFVQPITVDKNFQKEFKSAYRAKCYVSLLNSAYFIYNALDPTIQAFQAQRFATLRNVKNTNTLDPNFVKYYTFFPSASNFKPIKKLAEQLTINKTTTIDKVLAIRDHFLARNTLNEPIFKYTDNPGIPGLPSASKLNYFLFESKKGYCAYYSGATLLLLRAMGIPSRIAVGFLSVDRSDKNKGWYWYYANQSHAWVEVYFPEYGWIDFDTTVGNEDAREAASADGTPPSPPAKAAFAISGYVTLTDSVKKEIVIQPVNFTYRDKIYMPAKETINLNAINANIIKDTIKLNFKNITVGDTIIGVNYNTKYFGFNDNNYSDLISKIKTPLPVDEVYVHPKQSVANTSKKEDPDNKPLSWISIFKIISVVVGVLLIMLLMLPSFIKLWLNYKTRSTDIISHYNAVQNYVQFYLHQTQQTNYTITPLEFSQQIDKKYETSYADFYASYMALKYNPHKSKYLKLQHEFLTDFITKTKVKNRFIKRLMHFINPITTFKYFTQYGK
jgi:protein-glutamine gamma-glutamyltransferase